VTYLVQFGRSAFVGAFDAPAAFTHGDRVVIRGPRGVELGAVLGPVADRFVPQVGAGGDILRAATPDDDAEAARLLARGRELLDTAAGLADERGLPLAFVDVEITLDGASAVLHGLPWADADADPLFAELAARFGLTIGFLDLSRTPVATDPPTGCGKPDCGSGGGCSEKGGCSSGSCSRGSVKSADDMTAYFRDLRQKMEAAGLARTPLA
jgi:hypothetical protein